MPNARGTAVDALIKVETDKAYSNIVLNNALKQSALSAADKAFASILFYGVLDRKITLDYILDSLTKTPFSKTDAYTANVLRTALFQILYLDRVPQSAAVNEAVKLIKNSKQKNKSGFVNGVLRSAIRNENLIPEPTNIKNISICYSCPEWIVKEFVKDYGIEQAAKILQEFLKPAEITLRVNTIKTTAKELIETGEIIGVEFEAAEDGNAVIAKNGFAIEKSELYKNGLVHAQDISSQRAISMLNPQKGERMLDLCASPGGKSFTAAISMKNSGEIIACDIYKSRTELISKGAKRLGLDIIKTAINDATLFNENLGEFDAVLCDVPCSGLGILRRKPDIKYKPECSFSDLESIQKNILDTSAAYVKKGGRLLYSTCTLRKSENEKQINKFLESHKDFKLIKSHTFLPHIDLTDGFFAALMVRE